ncbi:MAG TPA: hypothetical protein VHO70_05375 [Chitinispirillaceae bacterium]|nr:hypothetical protein [Chitinispirillaceae bacterium]
MKYMKLLMLVLVMIVFPVITDAQNLTFEVLSIEGTAKIQRSQKRTWEKIQVGEKINDNDLVETFFQTKMLMRFGEKNLIILGSNTKALLNIVAGEKKGASSVNLTVFSGGLFAKAIENCHISIYTANAVGEIDTGSISVVAESKSGETGFQLLGGSAFVRNIAQQNGKTLRAGLTTMILPNKEPTAPLYITNRHVAVLKHYFGNEYIEMELDAYGIKPTDEQGNQGYSRSFSTKDAEYADEGMHKKLFSLDKIYGGIIDDRNRNSLFYQPINKPSVLFSNKGELSLTAKFAFTGNGLRQQYILTANRSLGILDAGIRFMTGQNYASSMQPGFNSLQGILDKIHHLTIGKTIDSTFLKLGAIEHLTFGYGLIVKDYFNTSVNALYNPLGVTGQLHFGNGSGIKLFLNEITKPQVGGIYIGLNPSVYHLGLGYTFDADQYGNSSVPYGFRFSNQSTKGIFYPAKKNKPANVHVYTLDFNVEVFSYDDFLFNVRVEFAQKLFNGNDGYIFRVPYFMFDMGKYSLGGGFLIQKGRLLSCQFDSRYHSTRYHIKKGESSFLPDTVITLTNSLSPDRYATGFDLIFKTNPYKGVDVQFEWQQNISNTNAVLSPTDTGKGSDAPGDFSLKLSGRVNQDLVKVLRYGEIFVAQNHGTVEPGGGTFFKSWNFESGINALSMPLFLNLAFELGASFFYFDQGKLDNKIMSKDIIFELSAGVRWGFL